LSWIGKENDVESSLGDFGARKYDPELGRFTSVDPLWEEMPGFSPFHYCFNNPIMMRDPFGLEPDGQSTKRGSVFSKRNPDDAPDAVITDEFVCEAEGPWSHWWSLLEGSRRGNEWTAYTGAARMGEPTAADKLGLETRNAKMWNLVEPSIKPTSSILGIASVGSTVKTEMIDFAIRDRAGLSREGFRQLSKASRTATQAKILGSTGAKYLRFIKGINAIGNAVGIGYAAFAYIDKPTLGNLTRLAVQGAAAGAVFIPVVGWGVALGIGTADAIWGDRIYEWIDKR
jgi:RHS repeat-associated protein